MTALGLAVATMLAAEPMLDGRCDDHAAATPIEIGEGVAVRFTQTANHVWVCFTLPPDSYGGADLWVDAPGLSEPINLHASAQLGEWPLAKPDAVPANGESDKWWNNRDWTASVARFNGMNRVTTPNRPRFKLIGGREYQLAKSRFGRGEWRVRLTVEGVSTAAGMTTVRFKPLGEPHKLRID